MKKKLIVATLCLTMVVSLTPSSFAVTKSDVDENAQVTAEQSTEQSTEAKEVVENTEKNDDTVDETKDSTKKSIENEKQSKATEAAKVNVTIDGQTTGYDNLADALKAVNNSQSTSKITVKLAAETFTATANDQFRIDKSNVWIEGKNKNTVIDCGSYLCSGQAGFIITSSDVVVKNLTIKSNAKKATLKWVTMDENGGQIANGQLHGVTLANGNSEWGAYALNIHGVANMIVGNINITDAGSNAIALANAKVRIANSNIAGGSKNDIVFNYADKVAYKNPVNLTLVNTTLSNNSIYSGRPSSAQKDVLNTDLDLVKVEAKNGSGVFVAKDSEIAQNSYGIIKDGKEVRYSYFETAISNLTDGATLKLYKDAELSEVLWIKNLKDVTIDLNQKAIKAKDDFTTSDSEKYKNNVINVSAANNVTIKNGTLKAGAKNRHTLNITEGSSVTVKDVTVEKTNAEAGAPIIVNASSLAVEGTLKTVASGGSWYALNVDSNKGDAKIEFKDGSKMATAGDAVQAHMIYCETPEGNDPNQLIVNGEQAGVLPGGIVDNSAPKWNYNKVKWNNTLEIDATKEFTRDDAIKAFLKAEWVSDDTGFDHFVIAKYEWEHGDAYTKPFDAHKLGTYKVYAYAYDKTGKKTDRLGINVTVVDTTKPELTVAGPWETTLELGHKYEVPEATVKDNSGENLTAKVDRVTYATTKEGLKNSTDYSKEVKFDKVGWYKLRWVVVDSSNNKSYATKVVHVVDTTAPTATVEKDPVDPTNGKVTVTLKFDEEVEKMSMGWRPVGKDFTKWYKVFSENADETVEFTDANGNKGTKQVVVNNIDKKAPVVILSFDPTDLTNKNVKVTLVADEEVTVEGWTKVGESGKEYEKTFDHNVIDEIVVAKDLAGNETTQKFTIDYIDKNAPKVEYVKFDKETPAREVTVSVKFSEEVKLGVSSIGWKYDQAKQHWTKTFTENGIYTINAKDLAGNTVSQSFEIKNIDREAATVTQLIKPNDEFTNQDVTVTLIFSENVTIKADGWTKGATDNVWKKVFKENATETVEALDAAGNVTTVDVKVKNIDKIAPEIFTKSFTTYNPTNKDVTVDLYYTETVNIDLEGWEKVDANGEHWRKTFDKNGEYEVLAKDRAGNECITKININIIDKEGPMVKKVEYSTKEATKNNVVVKIEYSESVDVAGGDYRALNEERTVWEKVYRENTKETVIARDAAGNEVKEEIEINNIDKIKPLLIAILHNPIVEKTNQDVVVTLIFDESVTINAEGWYNDSIGNIWKKVFKENGEETLTAYDLVGNKIKEDIVVKVTNIDKVAPNAPEVIYSTKDATNEDVTVTLKYDEAVNFEGKGWVKADKECKVWEKVVTENGSETVVAKDDVGNSTETLVEVTNIDKVAPNAPEVIYSTKELTNEDVTVTLKYDEAVNFEGKGWVKADKECKVWEKVVTENGSETVVAKDAAGNLVETSIEVANIDKIAPVINGVEDGKIYDKAVIATVEDENIKEVIINDKVYEYHGQKIDFSNNGKYTLVAKDKAGNETAVSFEIAIPTEEDDNANVVDKNDKNDNNKADKEKSDKTQTGDEANLVFHVVGLLSSALVLAFIFRRRQMHK